MIATGLCALGVALGVAGQLFFRYHERPKPEGAIKVISSTLLLVIVFLQPHEHDLWAWVLAAMALSWAGDILMIGQARRWLAAGLVAFLLAHVFYVVAGATLVELARVPPVGLALTMVVVLLAGLLTFDRVWPNLGRLRYPSILYFCVIGVMTVTAICGWLSDPAVRSRQVFAVGAVLFLISDVGVALQRFKGRSFRTRAWGLPCYYAGQVLMAGSLGL